jgi:putative endopeptidase
MNKKLLLAAPLLALACSNPAPESWGYDPANGNPAVAPCDDFFEHANGGWIARTEIPSTESRWGAFNELAEENQKKLRALVDGLANGQHKKGSDAQLVGDYYASGMDSAAVEQAGLKYLQPELDKVRSLQTMEELATWWGQANHIGVTAPFDIYVGADEANSSQNILYLYQSGLGMPDREYYLKEDSTSVYIQQAYVAYLTGLFSKLGHPETDAAKHAQNVYALEKALATHQMSREDLRMPENTYNDTTQAELEAAAPNLFLGAYFKALGVQQDSLVVGTPDYLQQLNTLAPNVLFDSWKAYAEWHLADAFTEFLPHAFVKDEFAFYGKVLSGTKEMKPRWKRVLRMVQNGLSEQLGHLYVEQHFSPESKQRVEQMVEDLRSAYRVRIENLTWMSPATKTKALEKLNAFTYKIGYPNKWKDYSALQLSPDSYLQNAMAMRTFSNAENLAKVGKPVDREEWGMPAYMVNAYYNPSNNEVVFPAGILQPPFYSPTADDAINYGGIGGVIGHEFTHGFDDQGSKYDAKGNLSNWWTEEDRTAFDALAGRLAEQYSGYEVLPGVFVNGQLTLGENIADLGGLTLAYHAYLKHLEGKPEPPVLDGFTAKQRVFLGWAGVWQTKATDEYLRNQVVTDPHSPASFRVIGPMANMPEFKEAFGCTDGAMIKKEPIIIW